MNRSDIEKVRNEECEVNVIKFMILIF